MTGHGLYLAAIIFSLLGVATIDVRLKLALLVQTKRALATLAISVAFFLIWDLNGIALGIFWEGSDRFLTGVNLLPQLPLEEPFFLLLLCYLILVLFLGFTRRLEAMKNEAHQ